MTARIRRGLYAITDTELLADGKLPEHVGQAIRDARSALLDGELQTDRALDWTIDRARDLAAAS